MHSASSESSASSEGSGSSVLPERGRAIGRSCDSARQEWRSLSDQKGVLRVGLCIPWFSWTLWISLFYDNRSRLNLPTTLPAEKRARRAAHACSRPRPSHETSYRVKAVPRVFDNADILNWLASQVRHVAHCCDTNTRLRLLDQGNYVVSPCLPPLHKNRRWYRTG